MFRSMCCSFLIITVFGSSAKVMSTGTEKEMFKALDENRNEEGAWKYSPLSGPQFDTKHTKNISTEVGKTAILNCRIKYSAGKTISWIRSRDLHLLTVGGFTYTSDQRFRAIHRKGAEDWLLKIHYVQHRDHGRYDCQVSTTPPISYPVWFHVAVEPVTQLLGGPDIFINSGSTINLTCVVNHIQTPPEYIKWHHDKKTISYDSARGGITIVTEHAGNSSSRLLIQNAELSDAGIYMCDPQNAKRDSILVHIIHNEHPAAIQHKNGTSSSSGHRITLTNYVYFILLYASFCLLPVINISVDKSRVNSYSDQNVYSVKCFKSVSKIGRQV